MTLAGILVNESTLDTRYLQFIIDMDHRIFAQKLSRLSATIVVIYDILLTMDREIEFFWKQRWSPIKGIFLVNRYGGLFFLVVDTWGSVTDYRTNSFCSFQFYFQQWTGWIAVLLIEVILIIRVNTLYERSRSSTLLLAFVFSLQAGLMATILIKWDLMSTLTYYKDFNACGSTIRPPVWLAFFWLPPIIVDFFLLILTIRKSIGFRKMAAGANWGDLRLHKTLVRDQALYFVGILICSVANMSFVAFYPYIMCAALGFAFGFPCVMGSRILINLREIARDDMRNGLSTNRVFSSLQFAEASAFRQQDASLELGDLGLDREPDNSIEERVEVV